MQNKILVVALGGTIGSVRKSKISLDENNLKILDFIDKKGVEFIGASPFSVLSENMSIELWQRLIDYLKGVDFGAYLGVIILHGSDTLAFTSSIIANAFPNEKIVLVASDKPIEDENSNGILNFSSAVALISSGINTPMVCYDGIHKADCITSADINDNFKALDSTIPPVNSTNISDKNILIVKAYPNNSYKNYNLDNLDAVLFEMYHSATISENVFEFCRILERKNIPYYFVTHKSSAEYETAEGLKRIIFNCTVENAYAHILLSK